MSGHDCGHRCCTTRTDPHHDHFLTADQCCGHADYDVPMFADVAEVSAVDEPRTAEEQAALEAFVDRTNARLADALDPVLEETAALLGVADVRSTDEILDELARHEGREVEQ